MLVPVNLSTAPPEGKAALYFSWSVMVAPVTCSEEVLPALRVPEMESTLELKEKV
ncbi:hypothetical protein D9M71_741320 [compost metagenome]